MMAYRMTDKFLKCAKLLDLNLKEVEELELEAYDRCDDIALVVVDSLLYIKDFDNFKNEDGFLVNHEVAKDVMFDYCKDIFNSLNIDYDTNKYLLANFIEKAVDKYKEKPLDSI